MSHELYDVTDFEIVDDYTIRVSFDDGTEQIIDFEPVLTGPIFGLLRDKEVFDKVELKLGTLVWPNGADFDPAVLHDWSDQVDDIIRRRRQQVAR